MLKLLVDDVCFVPDNQHIWNETCWCLSRLPANIFISEPEADFSFVLVCLVQPVRDEVKQIIHNPFNIFSLSVDQCHACDL